MATIRLVFFTVRCDRVVVRCFELLARRSTSYRFHLALGDGRIPDPAIGLQRQSGADQLVAILLPVLPA